MNLHIALITGLFAALLMFCGDMLLYFTPRRFDMDGTLKPYIEIMKKFPEYRIRLGGLLGPLAAFFYCVGFSQVVFATTEAYRILAVISALVSAVGIIVGGAYHAQFTYLGLVGKYGNNSIIPSMLKNLSMLSTLSMLPLAMGSVILSGLIGLGKTIFPPWIIVLTPTITIFLNYLWIKTPQPFRMILFGGWYNLIYAIFFSVALLVV